MVYAFQITRLNYPHGGEMEVQSTAKCMRNGYYHKSHSPVSDRQGGLAAQLHFTLSKCVCSPLTTTISSMIYASSAQFNSVKDVSVLFSAVITSGEGCKDRRQAAGRKAGLEQGWSGLVGFSMDSSDRFHKAWLYREPPNGGGQGTDREYKWK